MEGVRLVITEEIEKLRARGKFPIRISNQNSIIYILKNLFLKFVILRFFNKYYILDLDIKCRNRGKERIAVTKRKKRVDRSK